MPATYDSIATTTLGSVASSITLSSIPSGYTDIRVVFSGGPSSNLGNWNVRFNGDAGTNYSYTLLAGWGGGISGLRATNQDSMPIDDAFNGLTTGPKLVILDIFNYSGNTNKALFVQSSFDNNSVGASSNYVGSWRNTSALSSITFRNTNGTNTYAVGTMVTVYGILRA